ncbi:FAD-dependent oxidoreductase [Exiguobacterium antarcticum]|uniref:FAD-dependent oxidoreductase n=1 Tax=Exiguobacterium antarcticum TaxID=132920 RepID=UPI001ED98E0A|nr:FAD-dependent oxidoreductase [Exiguobacterium antarcticum]
MKQRVAVIGAGPGGLACAMLLAGRGVDVTVYEKQPIVGGRTSRVQVGDYQFDRGPTFLNAYAAYSRKSFYEYRSKTE